MGEYERAWVIWFNWCYFNVSVLFNLKHRKTDIDLSAFKHFRGLKYAEPILDLDFWGKTVSTGGGGGGVMNETHLSVFYTVSNRACRKRSTNSVSSAARYAFNSLFYSRARDFTTFTLHDLTDFYIERRQHRITIHIIHVFIATGQILKRN